MARPSSIDKLPSELKDQIVELRKQGVSIDRILISLRELGAQISRAALGRHTAEIDELLKDALEAREVARAMREDWTAEADSDVLLANEQFLQVAIMKLQIAVRRGEAGAFDIKELLALSKALECLSRTRKAYLELKAAARKEALAEVQEEVRRKLAEAAQTGAGGFNEQAAQEARRILGFA